MGANMFMARLSEKTYWKIGGICESYYEVRDIEELIYAVDTIKTIDKEYVVIGNGTNVLFDSDGFDNAVIKLGKGFNFISVLDNNCIEVGASTWVPSLVRRLSVMGFGGIEHCIGIPATFGGLVAMNGGSQRKSISENLVKIKYLDSDGVVKIFDVFPENFTYRNSPFKNSGKVILSAIIQCDVIKPRSNQYTLLSILRERRSKFPRKEPNCGSVFLSSPDVFSKIGPPGYVIESLGLKGIKFGGAQISPIHANFIVNKNFATSDDVLGLVTLINDNCWSRYNFKMEAEAIYYPKSGKPCSLDSVKLNEI